MCKELKRLIDLSECKHLNKTDRDSLQWAIQQLSPDKPETETSFDNWDFQAWPSVPDKKIFRELIKSRRAARGGKIMTQAYIDMAAPHLYEISHAGITVNDALKVATIGGWVSIQANWVINEIGKQEKENSIDIKTPDQAIEMINNGSITDFNKFDKNIKKFIKTQYMFKKYDPETMSNLEKAGFVL